MFLPLKVEFYCDDFTNLNTYLEGPSLDLSFTRQVDLVWTPVPEPTSVFVMCVMGSAIGYGVRRRRKLSQT